jgi:hypothetical protein
MTVSPETGAAPAVYPSIRQLYPEDAANSPDWLDWTTRPVLLLRGQGHRIPEHWSKDGDGVPGPSAVAFASAMAERGYDMSDVSVTNRESDRLHHFRWERNTAWRDLPIIGDPGWVPHFTSVHAVDAQGCAVWEQSIYQIQLGKPVGLARRLMKGVRLVVVDTPDLDEELLDDVGILLESDMAEYPVSVAWFDGKSMRPVKPEDIRAIRDRHRPEQRFIFNYVRNAVILCSRALSQVAREDSELERMALEAFLLPRLDDMNWMFGHPLSMCLLRHVAGRDGEAVSGMLPESFSDTPGNVARNPFALLDEATSMYRFRLEGSGRYPAWEMGPFLAVSPHSFAPGPRAPSWLWTVPHAVSRLRLVGSDAEGHWVLTARGRRFLELVGSSLDDPDMLLRWRTVDGRLGEDADIPAMDRWLNRAFRAVKRRVSALPATLSADAAPADAKPEADASWKERLLCGCTLDLTEDDLSDPEVEEAVAELEASDAQWPDARVGIERIPQVPGGVRVWCGVPIGVFFRGQLIQNPPWFRRNLEPIFKEAEIALASLPPVLSRHPKLGPMALQTLERTTAPEARFVELPRLVPEGTPLTRVFFGRWMRVGPEEMADPAVAAEVGAIRATAFAWKHFGIEKEGAVNITEGGDPPWVVWGGDVLVAVDETTGAAVGDFVPLGDCEARGHSAATELPAVLSSHREMAPLGLWWLDSNGNVGEVADVTADFVDKEKALAMGRLDVVRKRVLRLVGDDPETDRFMVSH